MSGRPFLRTVVITGTLAITLAAADPAAADRPLDLSLADGELVVDLLDPGATAVLFTIQRSSAGYLADNKRRSEWLVDDDGDGIVRVEVEGEIPTKFLAIAVELGSGRFDVWVPDDSPAREIALPLHSLLHGSGNRLDHLEDQNRYVELLLVRPSVGAWRLRTWDGGLADESPSSDGVTLTALASLEALGDSGSVPEEFERDDLLFRIAPREMEYYVARIVREGE